MGAIWERVAALHRLTDDGPRDLLTAASTLLEVMMTTSDLKAAFPSLGDAERRNQMNDVPQVAEDPPEHAGRP